MCIKAFMEAELITLLPAMETTSLLLLGLLVTCSVLAVQGRTIEVSIDDQEDVDVSMEAQGLPGVCWACKWALKKVKKFAGPNATAEVLKSKLLSVCDEIGLLKSLCRGFVKKHLGELIEELTTSDDVRTICVNTGACKPKEGFQLLFYPKDEDTHVELTEITEIRRKE